MLGAPGETDVDMTSDRPLNCGYLMKGPGVPCGLPPGHEPPHRPAPETAKPAGNVPSHVEQQDAAYREQLGVEPGGKLPSAVGGEAKVTGRPRRSRPRRWSAVTTTSVDQEKDTPGDDGGG
jgi:hypothetical protein